MARDGSVSPADPIVEVDGCIHLLDKGC